MRQRWHEGRLGQVDSLGRTPSDALPTAGQTDRRAGRLRLSSGAATATALTLPGIFHITLPILTCRNRSPWVPVFRRRGGRGRVMVFLPHFVCGDWVCETRAEEGEQRALRPLSIVCLCVPYVRRSAAPVPTAIWR